MPAEVPSFGSFAPPAPPSKDLDEDGKRKHRRSHAESSSASSSKRHRAEHRHHRHRDGEDSEDARPRKRSHRHDEEREARHRDDDKRTSDNPRHSRSSHSSKGKERAIDPPRPPTLDPSIGLLDRHGDALSARYGSPEQSKVSQYKRSGSGIVLGLPSSLRILPEDKSALSSSSTGLRVGPKGLQKKSRSLLDDAAELKRNSAAPRRLLPSRDNPGRLDDDFVSLRSSGRPSKHNAAQAVAVYDPLQTKVADDDPSDEEDDHSDSEDGNDIYADSDLRSRLLELDAATRERPEDSRVWIQLAQLQKKLVDKGMSTWPHANAGQVVEQPESSSSSRSSARRQRALAEVQVSILDRARATHWHHQTFDIILARLHLVTTHGLEPHQAIEKEWRKLLNYLIASEALGLCWSRYLEWRCSESDYATHKVVDGVDNDGEGSFVEAFRAMHARHDPPRAMMFHLQRRLCQVLARAGYRARAFAILQAQLEYTFACPPEIDEQQDKARRETYILLLGFHERQAQEKLDALQEFWESEVPRFGEEGAKGWKVWVANRAAAGGKDEEEGGLAPNSHQHATDHSTWEDPQSLLPDAEGRAPSDTALARWLAWQRRLASRRARPSRTTDVADLAAGEGEVDPHSVVFFSDVRPFIITAYDTEEAKEETLRSALDFLGLTSHEAAMTTAWPEDFSTSEPQTQPRFDVVDGEAMQRQRASLLSEVDRFPFGDTSFLLAGGESLWPRLKGLSALPPASSLPPGSLEASLVLLEGLQPYRDTRELRLKLVELLKGPQTAAQWAKELLAAAASENETEEAMWPLWRAFAWLQRKQGNFKSARKVYKSCLEFEGMVAKWGTVIWTEWLELEIEAGESDAAAAIAVAFDAITTSFGTHSQPRAAAASAPSPADILRAKSKALTLAKEPSEAQTGDASAIIAAWLAYLTSPNPSQRLTTTIHTCNDLICAAPFTHGGLHMRATHRRRLYLHALLTRIISYHLSLPRRPIYRPADVRGSLLSALDTSVKVGTTDDVLHFLTHLAAHESRFKIDGVLRRSIQSHLLSPLIDAKAAHLDPRDRYRTFEGGEDTEALGEAERAWLGAVYFEMHLHRDHVNANAVRALLERGVQEFDATRRCGAIWRLYVGFEVRVALRDHRGDGGSGSSSSSSDKRKLRKALQRRAKPVLYRAIARCPYDAALCLSAFQEPLVGAFSQDELEQMVGVMANERDLRVYGKVQEVRELLRSRREGGKEEEERGEGSSGSEGEAEDEDED